MTSTLLPILPAVDDVLFNFAQSDGLSQANRVNSARNQRLTATVVFLDAGVTDYQSLQAGVIPEVATVILSANQDGIEQISAFLQQNPQITTIHLVSHGAPGCLHLGNCQLNLTNIYDYSQKLQNWAKINRILLYGCQVAAGDAGTEFINKLSQITGAKIAASSRRVGNAALGGSWELEVSLPAIKGENQTFVETLDLSELQTSGVFQPDILNTYPGVFAPTLVGVWDRLSYAYGVTVVGNYAYAVGDTLEIIDISNPSNPIFKGNYAISNGQDVQIVGNYAYVADGWSGGLQIIDISNPTNPTLKGNYDTSGVAYGVQVVGNYAYVANWGSGLQIIDISNPTNPTLKGNYNTSDLAWDVEVVGNYAYVADGTSGLQIIDISNPTNPTLKGNYNTSGYAIDVQIVGNYAYVADDWFGLQIIDISNPTNPTLKGNYNTSGDAYGVQVVGNYAYVADDWSGLQIIDISNPTNPTLKGNYDTSGAALDVQIVGNYAYVADSGSGLQIIDISNPTNPTLKGNYEPSNSNDVQIVGNYAYVADGVSGLQIIDISNPTNPTLKGNYNTSGYAQDVQIVGNYAYVADRDSGLQIIDISNPTNPTLKGNYNTSGYAYGVQVVGNYAYVADDWSGLQIIDISNPINPTLKGNYNTSGYAYDVQIVGNYAYVADGYSGLQIIDISNPTTPTLKGNYDTADAQDVQVVGNYAYVADSVIGLQIIDISNPTNPILVGAYSTNAAAEGVQVVGNYAYLADGDNWYDWSGLQIIDISNPTTPILVGKCNTSGDAEGVQIVGNYAYVADKSGGLNIIDVSEFTNPQTVTVTLAVSPSSVSEDGTANMAYTFTRSGVTTNALTVNYTVGGTATFSTDYTQSGAATFTSKTGTVTFAANSTTAKVTIDPTADTTVENNETVALTLAAGTGYKVGTTTPVTGTINDDELPIINLAVSPANVYEDSTQNLLYTFTRMGSTKNALTINYNLAGTATLNTDYTRTGTNNTVTFAAGSSTATVTVDPTADTTIEPNETVILTLAAGTGYKVGTTTPVTGTIFNDDTPSSPGTLSFGSPTFSINENGTPVTAVTVTRTGGSNGAVSATVKLTNGTATAPSDYNNNSITVNFANGEISKTVTVPIVNDTLPEPDETVQLILINPTSGATIGSQNTATLNIVDNDAAILITGFPQGSQGSNLGKSTIIIAGQNFSPTDKISIISPTGTETLANQVYWVNKTEAWATFNLQGLATGQYDVKVMNGINTYTSNDTFTVNNDPLGNLNIELSYPASGFVKVTYTNIGQTDLIAPLLRINATNATVNYPAENTISATLKQLLNLSLATSDNGPAGILAPGESGEFYFQYTPNGNGLINFTVNQVPANEVINWATIKAETRPDYSYIDTAAWDALWSNLTASLGTTAGQFQAVMAENANHLSQLGQETSDLTRLFAFEWKQAANTLTNVDLLSTTDVVDTAPGLSLSFNRTFYQSIAERYNLGTLGRGWSSQWDLRATTNSQGDVIIRSVGDLQRIFEKQTGDTYTGEGGATLTIVGGQYRLKEASGFISLFGSNGKLNYVEDTNGNRITLQYTNNNLTKLVHTNGDSLTLTYNAQGRINKITDSAGQATTYSYDTTGENLLSVTGVDGTITYTYDTGNVAAKKYSLLSVKSDLGYQRSFEYDNQGRLTKESSNGNTQTLTYSYDSVGGVTITDSTGASQTVLLDDGRNAGQIRGVNNQNLLFNDDADGNLLGVTLPNGSQSSYSYDSKDNLTQQTNLLGQKTKFTYDATFNQLTSFTDPKGNGVGYSYDTKANLNKITYSDGSTQQFTVDALGNITSYINRRGSNISYTYNTSGLLTKKQYGNSSSVNYSYDTRGNLTSVVDGTGTMAMQYDTANRLTKITYPNGRSLSYTYNADGQRTKLVSSDGYTTNYTYDTVGRLKSLTNGTGQNIISYAYDSAGRLIKETNGNGTYTTYEYDLQDQLTKLVNYKANNTVNSKYEYTYDNLGRRTTMTTLEGVFEYGYDAIGQLTSVITPTNRTITYTYDAAGNRIGVTDSGVTTNYTTNNLNQYSNVGNGVYTYDTDGNLISKTQGGQTSNYTYDAESRLVKVVTPSGTWDYEYDGLGNRTATIFNGQKTEYLVDPFGLGDVVGEYNNNSLVANYTHGIGLVSRVNGNNSNYYDADAIGSTVGLTATDGSYVNKYSYLPFGEDLTKIEAVANPFEYVGQWGVTDEGNGLDFMRARFYDSSLGRFTSVDPINLAGGDTNFYRYVFNSPNTLTDPSGLSCKRLRDFGINYLEKIILYLPFLIAGGVLGAAGASIGYAITVLRGIQITKLINRGAAIGGAIALGLEPIAESYLEDWLEENLPQCPPEPPPPPDKDFIGPPPPPPGPDGGGGSWGDPHLTTFDGIKYDFQSVGEFTLVKSTTDDFEIQTRQQPWGSSTSVSVNSAIAIKLGGQRIGFYLNDPNPLKINGIAANLPNGQLYAIGQNLIVRDGDSYSIFSANNDYINIDFNSTYININLGLAENRKGNLIGLLGNYNGTTNDDFALRNGTVIGGTITTGQLYGEYDDSWRITQATSLFDYGTGQNTNTFTDLTFPNNVITIDSLTPAQRAAAEQIAINAGITDPDILNDAILDIFLTNGAPEIIQGYVTRQRQATISATNTLINPEGFGDQHWLTSGEVIPYTIRFTNNAAAGTIPVAQVTITQTLDSDLDLNTFTLQDFGFGNITVNVPVGTRNYSQRLDLRTTRGVFVDVNASLNTSTRVLTWTFIAIDPTTGNPANSTTQGFLPPNDANGSGTGFVGYSIQPKANNPTNTRIDAQASITLNTQTIPTNPVFNTVGDTSVTLAVSPASVTEDGTANLIYTFTRSGVLTNALTVNYTLGGTATLNTDYTRSGTNNTVTFAANSTTAKVTVDPTADTTVETDETVILTLASGTGYTIGTTTPVTGTIKNDDTNVTLPSVTLAVSPASVTEDGTANLIYTFTRSGVLTNALTVNYSISGTATNGSDYAALPTSIAFAAGLSTATVIVDPKADTTVETNETVTLTLASGTGYKVGTTTPVTGTITNDDFPQLSINNITVVEGLDNNAILTVTVNNSNPQPISVNYTTAPINATANVDYTSKTGTITIAPNTATATISIPLLNDNLNEPDEVFTVTLSNPVNATINPDEAIGQVIITDTLQSAITRTLPNNVENLRLIGTNNINGTGNAGNNNITGNSGNNQINGRAGIDTLTGGLGADTFIFQFGQSTISTRDRITDFAINSDKIDLLTQAGNATSAPSNFSRAANSTATTLQNLINQVFTDANGAITGNQGLGVNSAALVQVTTGAIAGTYLVINDSTAGFQSSNDLLINITGFTGTLPALGNIPVGNFFI